MKKFPFFLILLFAAIVTVSFAFKNEDNSTGAAAPVVTTPVKAVSAYDSLHLDASGLSRQAFDYAVEGVEKLNALGKLANPSLVTIIDFNQPSYNKRLYIVDLKNYKVLFNTWVAHGRNSGRAFAQSFSNTLSSLKSSPGFYVTGDTYMGGNGYSLKLNGMEKGINDKAMERSIVLHGADYVSQGFIRTLGYIGRSFGCPAVSLKEAQPIINTIKNGTCLFIYPPGQTYLHRSQILG